MSPARTVARRRTVIIPALQLTLLALVGALLVAFAVQALLALTDSSGPGSLDIISSAASVVLLFVSLVTLFMGQPNPVTQRLHRWKVRRDFLSRDVEPTRSVTREEMRESAGRLVDVLGELTDERDPSPGRAISIWREMERANAGERTEGGSTVQRDLDRLSGLAPWLRAGASDLENSLLTRILFAKQSAAVAANAREVARAIESIGRLEPVGATGERAGTAGEPQEAAVFADWVSQTTGALVLADASRSRGGTFAEVIVVVRDSFSPMGTDPTLRTYTAHHDSRTACPYWESMKGEAKYKPGDYDGLTLDIEECSTMLDQDSGRLKLVVSAQESCYAATEISEYRCKHLELDESGALIGNPAPRWRLSPWGAVRRSCERLTLATAFAAIVLVDERADHLVLVRRSGSNRSGNERLAAAGGVVNPGLSSGAGDTTDDGFPDIEGAVLRELEEELGLDPADARATCFGVYVYNDSAKRARGGDAGTSTRTGPGELVGTFGYIVRTEGSPNDLERAREINASVEGRYENEGLVFVEIPRVDPGGSMAQRSDGAATMSAEDGAATFVENLLVHADSLDQRAWVSALYVGAAQYGEAAIMRALPAALAGAGARSPRDRAFCDLSDLVDA